VGLTIAEDRTNKDCFAEVDSLQIGLSEIDVLQVQVLKIGTCQVRFEIVSLRPCEVPLSSAEFEETYVLFVCHRARLGVLEATAAA